MKIGGDQLFAFFSRNLTASPTVRMVSAASSGISQPNSSSKAMTSSTVSRLSAPRSSMKLAFSVTLSASTPRCSTTIFFTRSEISLISASPVPKLPVLILRTSPRAGGSRTPERQSHRRVDRGGIVVCQAPTKRPLAYHTLPSLESSRDGGQRVLQVVPRG